MAAVENGAKRYDSEAQAVNLIQLLEGRAPPIPRIIHE